jgi:aryl-alcohol dehydrogenase-like predicted oxidoreductase
MDTRELGRLWPVSALTLGGGGIAGEWGATSRAEAVATVREAVTLGITLIDVAPTYGDGEAELVVGEAFDGRIPAGVRISTKHHVGNASAAEVVPAMERSLAESMARMRIPFVDLFILHSPITPDERLGASWRTPLPLFREVVRPAVVRLVKQGQIGGWGITAADPPSVIETVLQEDPAPAVAQMIANALDAPGDMQWSDETPRPRELIALAVDRGVGVMGIRALQAGALTDRLDRPLERSDPARLDFERAHPFRQLAADLGESAASLAYRYALAMTGVDTVVVGVKNRDELREAVRACSLGPLSRDVIDRIDQRIDGRSPTV